MTERGHIRAELLALLGALAFAGVALAGPNIITSRSTINGTAHVVGYAMGRAQIKIAVPTTAVTSVDCGPMDQATGTWLTIPVGGSETYGIEYRGDYTGSEPIGCYLNSAQATATSIIVHVHEEGGMMQTTPTVTATATATPADTATATTAPTNTP